MLIPKWLSLLKPESCRRIVYLITGMGTPSDAVAEHIDSNSTGETGQLCQKFIEQMCGPELEVVCVHSPTNLFRYDENIVFVKRDLMPRIERLRNELADRHGGKWRSLLKVTMSFADGPSARISAINAALRIYRPSYLHFWQLKTFWHQVAIDKGTHDTKSFA